MTFTRLGRLLLAWASATLFTAYLTGDVMGWSPWPMIIFNGLVGIGSGFGVVAFLEGATAIRAGLIVLIMGVLAWLVTVAVFILFIPAGARP